MSLACSVWYLCAPERRPTIEEVIADVLAHSTARIRISSDDCDPPKPPAPSKKLEQDVVALPSRATSHVCRENWMSHYISDSLNSRLEAVLPGSSAPRPADSKANDGNESPPIEYSGKWCAVIRGRRTGVFQESL